MDRPACGQHKRGRAVYCRHVVSCVRPACCRLVCYVKPGHGHIRPTRAAEHAWSSQTELPRSICVVWALRREHVAIGRKVAHCATLRPNVKPGSTSHRSWTHPTYPGGRACLGIADRVAEVYMRRLGVEARTRRNRSQSGAFARPNAIEDSKEQPNAVQAPSRRIHDRHTGACPTQEAHLPRKFGRPLGLPPLTRCVGADGPTTCAILALPALLPARAHGPSLA